MYNACVRRRLVDPMNLYYVLFLACFVCLIFLCLIYESCLIVLVPIIILKNYKQMSLYGTFYSSLSYSCQHLTPPIYSNTYRYGFVHYYIIFCLVLLLPRLRMLTSTLTLTWPRRRKSTWQLEDVSRPDLSCSPERSRCLTCPRQRIPTTGTWLTGWGPAAGQTATPESTEVKAFNRDLSTCRREYFLSKFFSL